MPTERSLIQVNVRSSGDQRWRLTWRDPEPTYGELSYEVNARHLRAAAKEVRRALQKLVDYALDQDKKLRRDAELAKKGGAARAHRRFGPALKELARKGADLRETLLSGIGDGAPAAVDVRQKLLPERHPCMIMINTAQNIYIPWGLTYEGDPEELPDDPDETPLGAYGGFWCIKYLLSTLYNLANMRGVAKPRTNKQAQMLSVVNRKDWDKAKGTLGGKEKKFFDRVWKQRNVMVDSGKDFFKEWKDRRDDLDLLYFYCHAKGSKLSLGKGGVIPSWKFGTYVKHKPDQVRPACLVFLNGCQTAIGGEEGGFLEAASDGAFCGFIGTEAKVPDLFGLRFATDFYCHLLYDEMQVIEILERLREDHWPLSLLYSAWCHPFFRISKEDDKQGPAKPERNLSQEVVYADKTL